MSIKRFDFAWRQNIFNTCNVHMHKLRDCKNIMMVFKKTISLMKEVFCVLNLTKNNKLFLLTLIMNFNGVDLLRNTELEIIRNLNLFTISYYTHFLFSRKKEI